MDGRVFKCTSLFYRLDACTCLPASMHMYIPTCMQVAEAKEAGAAGVIGIVTQVTGFKGTALMSTFSVRVGGCDAHCVCAHGCVKYKVLVELLLSCIGLHDSQLHLWP